MAEGTKEDTIVEEEEQNEEGGEGGEGEEGGASNGVEGNLLEPVQSWKQLWQPEWDKNATIPDTTYAYKPGVLSLQTWKDIVHGQPATIADLPNGVVTIVRVPIPIANAVADPAGDLPPVLPQDVGGRWGSGLWKINWHQYLTDNYSGKNWVLPPNMPAFNQMYNNLHLFGAGYNIANNPQTPNNLNTSGATAEGQPWVTTTVHNWPKEFVEPGGESIFSSPASTNADSTSRPPSSMFGPGDVGDGVVNVLFGTEQPALKPSLSKAKQCMVVM